MGIHRIHEKKFRDRVPIANWGYSYATRLFELQGENQIENIINMLKSRPVAKSATISLLDKKMTQSINRVWFHWILK